MNEQIREYIEKYPDEIIAMFTRIRQILLDSVEGAVEEKLWAKIPSWYAGEAFVRLIPFKDHINVEAAAINQHKDEISGYKITPKGMLQIGLKNEMPEEFLKKVFVETLNAYLR